MCMGIRVCEIVEEETCNSHRALGQSNALCIANVQCVFELRKYTWVESVSTTPSGRLGEWYAKYTISKNVDDMQEHGR